MPRLARADSQARTRQLLLKAAGHVFFKKGIANASVDQIAERAGFSKGAFYSNFASKEAIVLVLLEEHMQAEAHTLATLLQSSQSLSELLEAVLALYRALHADPAICVLSLEFQLLALRDAAVRKRHQALWGAHRARLAELLAQSVARFGAVLRGEAGEAIDTLAALAHGLVLQGAVGRSGGATAASEAMVQHLRLVIEPA